MALLRAWWTSAFSPEQKIKSGKLRGLGVCSDKHTYTRTRQYKAHVCTCDWMLFIVSLWRVCAALRAIVWGWYYYPLCHPRSPPVIPPLAPELHCPSWEPHLNLIFHEIRWPSSRCNRTRWTEVLKWSTLPASPACVINSLYSYIFILCFLLSVSSFILPPAPLSEWLAQGLFTNLWQLFRPLIGCSFLSSVCFLCLALLCKLTHLLRLRFFSLPLYLPRPISFRFTVSRWCWVEGNVR